MITGLRVGAWWQMRVPIRVGFPASCSGLLDAWVKASPSGRPRVFPSPGPRSTDS